MDSLNTKSKQEFSIGDPKQNSYFAIILGCASFFISAYIAVGAVVMGIFGIYFSVKERSGVLVIVLNFLAVLIGFFVLLIPKFFE